MAYFGSWSIDDWVTFCCNTHDPDTGVATDADSVPTYRVYEDETGAAILNGSMAKLDDANTVGFYSERIQLTAGNGFEKGKSYSVYISATVDSDEGTMHHQLQIQAEVDAATVSDKTGYTVSTVSDKTGYALTSAERTSIADALLKRDWTAVSGEASRSVLNALRFLRNKWTVAVGTLVVREEDDTTIAWQASVTTDATADPVSEVDPT